MDYSYLANRNIVIYGAGNIAQCALVVLRSLMDKYSFRIEGFAVSQINEENKEISALPVRSIDAYVQQHDKDYFYLIAVKKYFVEQILEELKKRDIENYEIFNVSKHTNVLERKWEKTSGERYSQFRKNMDPKALTDEEYLIFLNKQLNDRKLNFEVSLVDHCNLNCQCCNHFSPLSDKKFADLNALQRDLQRIDDVYDSQIGRVLILGGEPLLHPGIDEALSIFRRCLPRADLELVSNGLLLPKMTKRFWQLMSENGIHLGVTVYPVKFDYAKCATLAEKYGVSASFGHASLGGIRELIKTTYLLPIKDDAMFNPYLMYAKCAHANYCVVVREGRIYNCSFAANVHIYNNYFEKNIPNGFDVSLDIYNSSREEIDDFLRLPNKMCSHCDIDGYKYDIPWSVSERDVREWMG